MIVLHLQVSSCVSHLPLVVSVVEGRWGALRSSLLSCYRWLIWVMSHQVLQLRRLLLNNIIPRTRYVRSSLWSDTFTLLSCSCGILLLALRFKLQLQRGICSTSVFDIQWDSFFISSREVVCDISLVWLCFIYFSASLHLLEAHQVYFWFCSFKVNAIIVVINFSDGFIRFLVCLRG